MHVTPVTLQDRRYLIDGMREEYTELEGLREALAAREEGKAMALRSAAVMAQLSQVTRSDVTVMQRPPCDRRP